MDANFREYNAREQMSNFHEASNWHNAFSLLLKFAFIRVHSRFKIAEDSRHE